jgi:hypothetical protein
MEVHHHAQTSRKKWTHYFWEFLMLFLAVFCGFLAEYQLEHKIEEDREKQYIKSLVRDIKDDISIINSLDQGWQINYNAADSLAAAIAGKEIITNSYPALKLIGDATGFSDFVSNDGTIQQLKNSGGLRLLRKALVVDSIMKYQKSIELTRIFQEGMNQHQLNAYQLYNIFDIITFRNAKDKNGISLLTTDKKSLNTAYAYVISWRDMFYWLRYFANKVKETGIRLLETIHRQYGIE